MVISFSSSGLDVSKILAFLGQKSSATLIRGPVGPAKETLKRAPLEAFMILLTDLTVSTSSVEVKAM
ncbi:unnamed protein product [Eruca vesicaria subsp. sativa]|uniref:Uncharacterized protein n=1 Tax=Eruca vesicaria subsp. sativa TaxID=29727 RepID=A0ABC8JAK2_ERUVS|nr:unnamed protein product [Eruca vesicaria subsp. sativa]